MVCVSEIEIGLFRNANNKARSRRRGRALRAGICVVQFANGGGGALYTFFFSLAAYAHAGQGLSCCLLEHRIARAKGTKKKRKSGISNIIISINRVW